MSSRFRSSLSRRGLLGGLAGVALALVAIAPTLPASAQDGGGSIILGARICDTVVADPILSCAPAEVGPVSLYSEDGTTVLTPDQAVADGGLLRWSPVALGNYFIDVDALAIPAGYQLWNIVPAYGNGGGSEYGWYVGVVPGAPEASLYAIYTPIGAEADPSTIDSDGDGASDADEIAWGSDPYDYNSVPGQADPDPSQVDTDGDGATDDVEIAYGSDPYDTNDHPAPLGGSSPIVPTPSSGSYSVTTLPNTGAGAAETADASDTALAVLLGGGALAFAGAALSARRRKA